jgi:Na+/H+ antiporter NhaC
MSGTCTGTGIGTGTETETSPKSLSEPIARELFLTAITAGYEGLATLFMTMFAKKDFATMRQILLNSITVLAKRHHQYLKDNRLEFVLIVAMINAAILIGTETPQFILCYPMLNKFLQKLDGHSPEEIAQFNSLLHYFAQE